jgi:uncharacterized membrane protein YdjX (TVP38/TMEM64 family)
MLGAVAVVLGVLMAAGPLHRGFVNWLAGAGSILSAHPMAGAVLLVLLAAASAMLAFLSSAVFLPAALQTWSEPVCAALLWIGWIVGGAVAYLIARYLGRAAVKALGSSKGLGRYESVVGAKSSFGLVVLFQLAVPSEIPGYLFGLARYPFLKFIGALAVAELPYALATVYAGSAFIERRVIPLVMLMALAAILGVGAFKSLRSRIAAP